MKVYTYRVGTGRIRATRRLGTRKPPRIRRLWAPYKHRELVLYLIGLSLILFCIFPVPVYYWQRLQAGRNFEVLAAQGQPFLAQIERMDDHGRAALMPNAAYQYGDPFPTSGPRDRDWADAGFYDAPRAPTLLVHSLERGAVVIYYGTPQPTAIRTLREWAGLFRGDRDGIVVVPHPALTNEIVLTAWDIRLRLPEFDPSAAAAFVDTFRGRGPEERIR